MMTEAFDARLNSIEKQVTRIADELSLLVRMDERMVTLFKSRDDHETRLRVVEVGMSSNSYTVSAWQKFGWIIAAALCAFALNVGRDWLGHPAVPPAPVAVQAGPTPSKSVQQSAQVH